jgi:biopolymer transport protein ExbD
MRSRRIRRHAAELDVTAFINLIVVLVPFLLSTAVFTRLSVIDLSLPAKATGAVEQLKVNDLKLEIVLRPDALEVGDRIGGLIQRIPNIPGANGTQGGYDLATLAQLVQQIKAKFPDTTTATLLAQPNTPYDTLIQVMDVVREVPAGHEAKARPVPLFPAISIGDAPIASKA